MEKTIEKNELSCALCNAEPHVHCESDEALLCYTCDAHVHRANFLVARHARAILCCKCKIPTRVHTSGPSLDKVVISTCDECAESIVTGEVEESVSGSDSDSDSNSDLNLNSCPDEEEEENGVVPVSVEEVTGWKRRRVPNGLEDQEDTSRYSTSDPCNTESVSSDDDATSLSSDSNPRAHKRSFLWHVVFSNEEHR
ncbi:uncharacterized protein LOC144569398 [Carex rostrata]